MKLLILGGTIFLGYHLVEEAQKRGHEITLFNRGKHNPHWFPGIEKLQGDRRSDLSALQGRDWDAVIDTCGYIPREVRDSARCLCQAVKQYTFISSLSVYTDTSKVGLDENAPVGKMADETVEEITGETYGPLKALCEQEAETVMPGRTLSIRAGLIVGPLDPSNRFTHWVHRVAKGGEVLAPGKPESPVEFIDVRDLSQWILTMIESGQTGIYNAAGLPTPMGDFLEECKRVSHSDAHFTWVEESFLLDEGLEPWTELPLWLPEKDPNSVGFSTFNSNKAIASGLKFRSISDTIQDALAWDKTRPVDTERRAGLKQEKETQVLQKWKAKQGKDSHI